MKDSDSRFILPAVPVRRPLAFSAALG